MSDGSIDIDDIEGDVSGVIKDSIGSFGAKIVNVGGNLVIHNSTTKERVTLKKIQHLSIEKNAIEKGIITTDEFNALQRAVIEIKNLLERNQAIKESKNRNYAANMLKEAVGTICRICARNKIALMCTGDANVSSKGIIPRPIGGTFLKHTVKMFYVCALEDMILTYKYKIFPINVIVEIFSLLRV